VDRGLARGLSHTAVLKAQDQHVMVTLPNDVLAVGRHHGQGGTS
jgi:hypothetical protein